MLFWLLGKGFAKDRKIKGHCDRAANKRGLRWSPLVQTYESCTSGYLDKWIPSELLSLVVQIDCNSVSQITVNHNPVIVGRFFSLYMTLICPDKYL
jgi:hypothetical protein